LLKYILAILVIHFFTFKFFSPSNDAVSIKHPEDLIPEQRGIISAGKNSPSTIFTISPT